MNIAIVSNKQIDQLDKTVKYKKNKSEKCTKDKLKVTGKGMTSISSRCWVRKKMEKKKSREILIQNLTIE